MVISVERMVSSRWSLPPSRLRITAGRHWGVETHGQRLGSRVLRWEWIGDSGCGTRLSPCFSREKPQENSPIFQSVFHAILEPIAPPFYACFCMDHLLFFARRLDRIILSGTRSTAELQWFRHIHVFLKIGVCNEAYTKLH